MNCRFYSSLMVMLLVSFKVMAQAPTLLAPRICHDAEKHLSCITEGNNVFEFQGGQFTGMHTMDSMVWYDDAGRFITFLRPYYGDVVTYDTTVLTLQKKSVLLKNKGSVVELTDLTNLSLAIKALSVFAYTDNQGSGLTLHLADGSVKLPIRQTRKGYVWDLEILRGTESVFLRSAGGDRVQMISASDDAIAHGFVVMMNGKTVNRVLSIQDGYASSLSISSSLKHSLQRNSEQEQFFYGYGKDGVVNKAIHGLFISCACK